MEAKDDKKTSDGESGWFDRPSSRRLLWKLLYGACILSVLAEIPLIVLHKRHGHFGDHSIDGWWFFYALLGFIACALMIIGAKWLGFGLKRPDNYYGEPEENECTSDDELVCGVTPGAGLGADDEALTCCTDYMAPVLPNWEVEGSFEVWNVAQSAPAVQGCCQSIKIPGEEGICFLFDNRLNSLFFLFNVNFFLTGSPCQYNNGK